MLTRGLCVIVCFCAVSMAKSQMFPFNLFSESGSKAKQGASFTFTHEGITPQEIVTGCQGTKFFNGEVHTEFYVIDSTGRKKFVYPGGSVEISFPSKFENKVNAVSYNEMCFPKQCGANSCGFVVGPVTAPEYPAKNAHKPSAPVVLSPVPVSSLLTVESGEKEAKQAPCPPATTPCPSTTTTTTPAPCPSATTTTTPAPCPSSTTTTTPAPCPSASTTTTPAPCPSTTTTTTPAPCPSASTTTTPAPCPSTTTTTTPAPCPSASTTTTPAPCPSTTPAPAPCPPPTPAPCPSTTPPCPPVVKEGDLVPFLPARSSYREPSDGPVTDASYYAKLPGAIRGNAGVIYYPSCEKSAFQQVAIIPFCGAVPNNHKKGRDLKEEEIPNELQSKLLTDHNNEVKEETEVQSN